MPATRAYLNLALATVGVLATVGAGRYGYPVILPAMLAGLDLSYTQAGLLTTASSLSWMALVPFTGLLAVRLGPTRVATAAMALCVLAMLLLATAATFATAVAAQILFGVGMGTALALFMTIPATQFSGQRRFLAAGIATSGVPLAAIGFGIVLPLVLEAGGEAGWRWAWFTLTGLALVVAVLCGLVLEAPAQAAPRTGWREVYRNRSMWHLCLTLLGYPIGHIIFGTFFVAFVVTERGLSSTGAGQIWAACGVAGVISGPFSGWMAGRIGRALTLAMGGVVICLTVGLLIVVQSPAILAVLAILYGLWMSSMLTIATGLATQYVGNRLAPAATGMLMLFAGGGQAIGATLGGQVRDLTGSFDAVFLVCVVLVGLATLSSFLLPEPTLGSRGPQPAGKRTES